MGKGYQVVLGDIQAVATAFGTESTTLHGLEPKLAPPPVGTGDAGLDATLRALLDTFGVYGSAITAKLSGHEKKLTTVHDNYKQNDADVVELFNTMLSALGEG